MVQARVIDTYPWKIIQSAGREFVRGEWRNVPAEAEREIRRNPALELRETDIEPVAETVTDTPPKRRKRHA